ncbi:MAG: hypothetical protein RSB51_04695 [Clostridia bacterium]
MKKKMKTVKGTRKLIRLIILDTISKIVLVFCPHNVITLMLVFTGKDDVKNASKIYLILNILVAFLTTYLYIDALKKEKLHIKLMYFIYNIIIILALVGLEIMHFKTLI